MKKLAILLLSLAWVGAAGALDARSLGYSDEGIVIGAGPDACGQGVPYWNHDGSFENGFAWAYNGNLPPYYGAFGEGYVAPFGYLNVVTCARIWVSTLPGYFTGQACDVYLWEGGVSGPPGSVMAMTPGVVLTNVPIWPTVGENDVDMMVSATGEFTIGYWGVWPDTECGYYCAVDVNGPGGYPWTCVAPGIGYPTGWNDPSMIWGPMQSMGLGVNCDEEVISPAEPQTWGALKALFQ